MLLTTVLGKPVTLVVSARTGKAGSVVNTHRAPCCALALDSRRGADQGSTCACDDFRLTGLFGGDRRLYVAAERTLHIGERTD